MKKLTFFFVLSLILLLGLPAHLFAQEANPNEGTGLFGNPNGSSGLVGNPNGSSGLVGNPNGGPSGTLGADIQNLIQFFNTSVVPLIFAIAFIVFLWGVFQYFIAGASDEEKRKTGRTFVLYGIIGFLIMLSVWGIVNILYHSLGFDNGTRPQLPTF